MLRRTIIVSTVTLAVLALILGLRAGTEPVTSPARLGPPHAPAARGTLRISHFGAGGAAAQPLTHTTVYVRGPDYTSMEDNDIRGYLDGNFKWGWNQPGQAHVRMGRRAESARFGEYELFRNLQRWDGITLPAGAVVTGARLDISLEVGATRPLTMMVYAVNKDWDPGRGGELENNVSPPRRGEVWWNEAAHGKQGWGLPGAGFAASGDPEADTDAMPLAEARYQPGDSMLSITSPRLAAYVTERVQSGRPLLFLLKLADDYEDLPGAHLTFFSASSDSDLHPGRRPRLVLEWSAASEREGAELDVYLEHGRTYRFPRRAVDGASLHSLSFIAEDSYAAPTLMVRGGTARDSSGWQSAALPFRAEWTWLDVMAISATNPLSLGQSFTQVIRDTWIRTGPPEGQEVPWVFVAPTGTVHAVNAQYQGNHQWEIRFTPDELGRWTFRWSHNFTNSPYQSPDGWFDVLIGDRDNARAQLDRFLERVRAAQPLADATATESFMIQFARLERAVLQQETPETFRSPEGDRLRAALNDVREVLGGEPVPDSIPMVADAPLAPPRPGFLRRLWARVTD